MNIDWLVVLLSLIPGILFFGWFYLKPTSLWTGFFLSLFLGSCYVFLIILIEKFSPPLARAFAVIAVLPFIFLGVFGIYAMIIGLFWNERVLLKYERPSLSNFVPLIVATFLIVMTLLLAIMPQFLDNPLISALFIVFNSCFGYFSLLFIYYSITAILYNHFPLWQKVDYIIVLGAGLNEDKVTPLLASRIEAGVRLYRQQVQRRNHKPRIILSGGQGSDELISEAAAMSRYLQEQHPDLENVYLEDKSTNTRENILFSEKVAQENDGILSFRTQRLVIASNNYHLLRAGKLARSLGIFARGVGAKTRLYYLPTAFIREYIAYLVMTKKRHLLITGLIILTALVSLIPN